MGWPGIVECTVIGEVSERDGKRSIMASFGLAPDLAVDRVDLVQAGLDRLELGATVEEVYGHDWIGDPFRRAPGWPCGRDRHPTSQLSKATGAQFIWPVLTSPGCGRVGWTGPSSPAGRRRPPWMRP